MKKYLLFFAVIFLAILYFASCKEQGNNYLVYRKVNGYTMQNVYGAYLVAKADTDTVLFEHLSYAEIEGKIFDVGDSLEILKIGHCLSQTNPTPTLTNCEKHTEYSLSELNIQDSTDTITFVSKFSNLELDVNYFARSFIIVKYKNSGITDTGYNQIVDTFPTKVEDLWLHRPDFNGEARTGATSFVLRDRQTNKYKGYLLTGWNGFTLLNDFWRYNQEDSTWTQLQNFPGSKRMSAVAFTIKDTLYFGTGLINKSPLKATADFWKWTEAGGGYNNWRQIDSLGINQERYDGVGFSVKDDDGHTYGIVGLGKTTGTGKTTGQYRKDFYYYRVDLDTPGAPNGRAWQQIQPFIGSGRAGAVVGVLKNRAIIGAGDTAGIMLNDFYVLNPNVIGQDQSPWSGLELAGNQELPPARTNAVAVALSYERYGNTFNYFYFGTGKGKDENGKTIYYNDWWRYDYITKKWKKMSDMRTINDVADGREGAIAFPLYRDVVPWGNHWRAIVIGGNNDSLEYGNYKKDVWEYLP